MLYRREANKNVHRATANLYNGCGEMPLLNLPLSLDHPPEGLDLHDGLPLPHAVLPGHIPSDLALNEDDALQDSSVQLLPERSIRRVPEEELSCSDLEIFLQGETNRHQIILDVLQR